MNTNVNPPVRRAALTPNVLESIAFNLCSLHDFDVAFVRENERFARAVITEYARCLLAGRSPEVGGATAEVLVRIKGRAESLERIGATQDASDLRAVLKALATREEAPAEAGEAINWKAEYETLCGQIIKDREAIAKIIDPEAFVPMEDVIGMRKAFVKADAILALRAQPQARKDAQPVAWQLLAQQQPKPGHKIITLHDDGSGAALLFVHDGGVIDSDGDDYDTIGSPQTWWAYLPDDFEFWCEGLPEEPVTLPAHRVPDHPATDALRVAVEALEPFAAHPDFHAGDDWPVTFVNDEERAPGVTAGDFRRARQALAALQAGQKGGAA